MQTIIIQSDSEQQNQAFFRLTPKMQPPCGAFRFDYKGYHNCDCHCTLQIVGNLVVCTEDLGNQGTSITNMAEHLATRVCYQFQIDPNQLTWIEHYQERGDRFYKRPEDFSIVSFQFVTGNDSIIRCLHPKWKHIEPDAVQTLIDAEKIKQ